METFRLGDNVYSNGTATEFANYYNPTWGASKSRTRPAPGNHDYNTSGATGYYNYFGTQAGRIDQAVLVQDLEVRVVNAITGELLTELTIDPDRDYQPGTPNEQHPNPHFRGFGCPRCPETSHGRADRI